MSTVTRRGPNSPIGYLGARKARNQQKRFGIRKFYPKPRTTEQWHEVYLKHKVEVPNVQQITLKWSSKGAGQTGIRHFSYYSVPPIKYFNENVQVEIEKTEQRSFHPEIVVTTNDGKSHSTTVRGKTNDQIRAWLVSAVGGRDVNELNYEPASEEVLVGSGTNKE